MASWSSQRRCRPFTLAEIDKATDSFNGANFLGIGGEGMVFKGVLVGQKGTSYVAVKRLTRLNSGEYENEIKMLSELHHANLVSLIGYCQQFDKKILVYDFMPNGSLRDNLYRTPCSLSWEQRLNICIGAARGLEYLHTGTSLAHKIIHRDVKPDNILLDENFAAKISDFGLSKRSPANQTHSWVSTALGRGTRGYYAPEYLTCGKITWRVDVFAYGVVLFEVLCKKKPWEQDDSNEDDSLRKWAQQNVDPVLKGAISQSCLEAFIDIAEKCLTRDPDQRPSMNEVVSKLIHAFKLQKSSDFGGSSRVENGEKRQVDSGDSSSKSPDSEKTLGHGDFRRSKSAKFKKTSPDRDDFTSGKSAKWEKTRQEGGSKSVELANSTKASKEIKPIRQETRAYKSSGVKNELGLQDGKYSYPIWEDGEILSEYNSGGEATNKEDTTKDKSNACGSSRTLADIPGTEDKVVLYYCASTSTNEAVTDYMKTRLYLNLYAVGIDERDPTMIEEYQVELSRFFTQRQKKFSLPQLFIGGKHIGGANEVERLHDSGEVRKYLAV